MELHKTLVLDPNSAAVSPKSSAVASTTPPATSVTSPISSNPPQMAFPTMPTFTIPAGMKPPTLQLMGMNGMHGINGGNGISHMPGLQTINGLQMPGINGMNSMNGMTGLNGYLGMMDPSLLMASIPQPLPQQPGSYGKVRLGMAAVKTGSPKFAPY